MSGEAAWICTQLGAREHYAIPRARSLVGGLECLLTDVWTPPPSPLARWGRFHSDLLGGRASGGLKIESANLRGVTRILRRRLASGQGNDWQRFCRDGKSFGSWVHGLLENGRLGEAEVFFGYDLSFLEGAEVAGQNGLKTVLGQVDPAMVEWERVEEERKRRPGWALGEADEEGFRLCQARREEEWALADRIVVNSAWTERALIAQGLEESKIEVVPLSYDLPDVQPGSGEGPRERGAGDDLRVLWLGQVILRKGIGYLFEAARQFLDQPVRFDVVGPIGVSAEALRQAPDNVRLVGPVKRSEVRNWYRSADLFVLPTLSDGFALTQLEAMSYGLPVVSTEACGDVVEPSVEGWRIPSGEVAPLVAAVEEAMEDPEGLAQKSLAARAKAKQFRLEHLAKRLSDLSARLRD